MAFFKVAKCNLKAGTTAQIHAVCLHRGAKGQAVCSNTAGPPVVAADTSLRQGYVGQAAVTTGATRGV